MGTGAQKENRTCETKKSDAKAQNAARSRKTAEPTSRGTKKSQNESKNKRVEKWAFWLTKCPFSMIIKKLMFYRTKVK